MIIDLVCGNVVTVWTGLCLFWRNEDTSVNKIDYVNLYRDILLRVIK